MGASGSASSNTKNETETLECPACPTCEDCNTREYISGDDIEYYPVKGTPYEFTVNRIQINEAVTEDMLRNIKDSDNSVMKQFYGDENGSSYDYLVMFVLCDKPWESPGPATVLLIALRGPDNDVFYNDDKGYDTTKRINAVFKSIVSKYKDYYIIMTDYEREIISMVTESPFVDRYDSKDFMITTRTEKDDVKILMNASKPGGTTMDDESIFWLRVLDENNRPAKFKLGDMDPRIIALIRRDTLMNRTDKNAMAAKLLVPPGKTLDEAINETFIEPQDKENNDTLYIIIGIVILVVFVSLLLTGRKGSTRNNLPSIQNKDERF